MSESVALAEGVDLRGHLHPGYEAILTREALDFVAALDGGAAVTAELVRKGIGAHIETLRAELGEDHEATRLDLAASLLQDIATAGEFAEFPTLPAYSHI
jgi:hypothetical protein